MDNVESLLEELTNAHGPSGFEGPVRAIMQRELSGLCDGLDTDGIGSLIGRLGEDGGSPRVMLAAHMDEVGLMVKLITKEGYVMFLPLGGWLDQALINQRWVIMTRNGPVLGVTGVKTPHVMTAEARGQLFKREQMFIDVGASSKEDAEERLAIRPGDPIAPDSRFTQLNGGALYLGKAWDDRVGLAVIVEVMRRLRESPPPNTLYGVATVQEEVGLRGAHTSSFAVEPDLGINLESGVASDYPGISQEEAQEKVGSGPAIFLHDSSMLPSLKLRDLFVDTARENDIPVQFDVLSGYGEDGAEMQRTHKGAPSINIAVPTRYLHSHNGIISREDFDRTVDLVEAVIRKLDADTVRELKSFD
ncbi:MAG: M42 family metallopeptidase [Chloroflexota bacterium]|nr:M42 family metallopeptidase [Chloroflexota bacterium]MDE2941253.1 M42 family metallopeptidase [Chloroflexota bacterium]MDE3267813.1 M42 family metallopeptidase [Chloroflexota bacterium]